MKSYEKGPGCLAVQSDIARGDQAVFGRSSTYRRMFPVGLALVVVAIFYAATVRDGNFWGDDYALYIHHAVNIVEGRAYAATGYIYNRAVPDYGPRAYPPVFPLLLVPIYWASGLNLHAMKVEEVFFFLLSLMTITAYSLPHLKPAYLVALVGILGFNPYLWSLKDSIISDFPFLLFFYLTALVAAHPLREGRWSLVWAVVTGILLYLCVGTRTIGISIAAGLVLFDIVKRRKVTGFTITAVLVCGAFMLVQRHFIGAGEQSYTDQLRPTLQSLLSNLRDYSRDFVFLWGRPWGTRVAVMIFVVTTLLASFGMFKHIRKGLTTVEAFLIPYLVIVWVWPSGQGLRFLLPLIPFYVFLVSLGVQELINSAGQGWIKLLAALPVFAIALSCAAFFRSANYNVIRQTDGRTSFNELCRFIQAHTDPNDVFLFRRSRALSLFTSRPAAVYDYSVAHPEQLAKDLYEFHAAYIVTSAIFEEDRAVLIPFVKSYLSHLDKVYENSDFEVYKIREDAIGSRDNPAYNGVVTRSHSTKHQP